MCSTECLSCSNRKDSNKAPMSESCFRNLSIAFLKQNSTADIFLEMFRLFLKKLFHKAPLNDSSGKDFILFTPWAGLHKVRCQSVIGELLWPLWEYWKNIIKAYTSLNPIHPKVFNKKAEKLIVKFRSATLQLYWK